GVDGILNWQAPQGNWTILRFGHTATGQQNHSAPTLGTGLDCDKFSRSALEFHFEKMFSRIMPILENAAKTGKVGLLIDSYEMGLQNWTGELPKAFKKRNGYAIVPFLPALVGRTVGDPLLTEQFLWDFRRTLADLMAENYYGHFKRLCEKHNLITYTEPYGHGPFEEMQIGEKIDINMGEFWAGITNLWPNSSLSKTVKIAASISRIKGESIIGAESFTAEPGSGKWQQYPFSMKSLGDRMFTKGVTRYYFHRYAHQPHPTAMPGMTMGPWGIHFERTNTWWKPGREWLKYITRCQYLLRQGRFVATLLYFTGEEVPIAMLDPEFCSYKPPHGYDYDLVNGKGLKGLYKDGGCFSLPGGTGYKVMILAEFEIASLEVLLDLKSLVERGLILVGPRPKRLPGISSMAQLTDFKTLIQSIWGDLDFTDEAKPHQLGIGRVYTCHDLSKVLSLENILPDLLKMKIARMRKRMDMR
ncbi:MAG: glycosyl hydrolase family 43, partial [Pedobacter sp.]